MEQEGGSMDSTSGPPSLPTPTLVEPSHLVNYVKRIASSVLEDDQELSPATTAALTSTLSDASDLIKKFISDPQIRTLFVQKISNKGRFNI